MNMLANLTTSADIADERDSVGGNPALESGLYPAKVTLAYLNKSNGGALGLVLKFQTESGDNVSQTLWMTSGTAKGCKNYYEKDGVKNYLPGFNQANSLALLTCGKEINAMETETKVVNVYSKDAKAEVPTKVEVLTEMLDKEIILGLIKQKVDKQIKNDAGDYVSAGNGETREENDIDKLFRYKDKKTTSEIKGQAEEATFIKTWESTWAGKTKDKSTKDGKGTAGAPKAAGAAGSSKPTVSLFA
jgi:hypothetical protein